MSVRYEYVPATAAVQYINDDQLDIEDPIGQPVLVLWYDEAIVIHGNHAQLIDLTDRIRVALDHNPTT